MARLVYRDYRPGGGGRFVSEATYNRSVGQGGELIHREYVGAAESPYIDSVDELYDYEDIEDFDTQEYFVTGDTGREE